jgi:hypothetical protein
MPEFDVLLKRVPIGNLLAAVASLDAARAPEHIVGFLAHAAAVQCPRCSPTLRRILSREGAGPILGSLVRGLPPTDREKADEVLAMTDAATTAADYRRAGRRAFDLLSSRVHGE